MKGPEFRKDVLGIVRNSEAGAVLLEEIHADERIQFHLDKLRGHSYITKDQVERMIRDEDKGWLRYTNTTESAVTLTKEGEQEIEPPQEVLVLDVWGGRHDQLPSDHLVALPVVRDVVQVAVRQRSDQGHGLHVALLVEEP